METFELCLAPEAVSNVAVRCPQNVALSRGDTHLTYEQLDTKANRFAGYLLHRGIASRETVALCMERSFDWIIAALGIMRAGAAYVPLDSEWPDARLRFAVENSGAALLVARLPLIERLHMEGRGIDPCVDAEAIATVPYYARRSEPESLAYVIYTSGSTGVPKGVEITHANLAHLNRWHRDAFDVTPDDRASHLAGLGFDAAVWEIWPHLCAGATVCLATDEARSSASSIQQWMLQERVTIGFVPTVHATAMLAMEWPSTTKLRFLLTGGDTLPYGPRTQLPFQVVNNYGPAECTVVATSSIVKPGLQGPPSIGRPITGTTLYLLNEDGTPVPDGSIGEIYIGGDGVGRGYRNLPESTQKSFFPDPFSRTPGGRMYRTGDRGVRRADEEIEFHGRLDRQTKIRGQRVELDEIASALANHPSIEFATVTAEGPSGGESQIVGYFRCKTGTDIPSPIELQQFLARSLPGYMIPAVFVRLGALPLSPNGKIDLKMLPRHTERPLKEETAVELVASPVERKLLSIVRELLGNQTVAAGDSFFLAGGHSLLGMQLVIRVRQAFGVDLTLRQLFEAPTVHTLSSIVENTIEQQRLARIWARVLGREGVRLDDNFFELGGHALVGTLQRCIAEEFGRWIATADLSRNPTLRQQTELTRQRGRIESALPPGVYALQPNGTWDSIFWVHYPGVELARALGNDQPYFSVALTSEECVSLGQHPTLEKLATNLVDKILATQADGPYVIGGFCLGGVLAYEVACQLRRAGREISLLALVDAPNPSYMARCDSLKRMVDYICYATKRARRLGPRTTMRHFMDRLFKRSRLDNGLNIAPAGIRVQEICEAAMRAYHPIRYDGRMLLLVATEHAPHRNFLESWRAVVPDLDARYVDAHHRDLLTTRNARTIADIMLPYLKSGAGGNSSYRSGNTSGNRVA